MAVPGSVAGFWSRDRHSHRRQCRWRQTMPRRRWGWSSHTRFRRRNGWQSAGRSPRAGPRHGRPPAGRARERRTRPPGTQRARNVHDAAWSPPLSVSTSPLVLALSYGLALHLRQPPVNAGEARPWLSERHGADVQMSGARFCGLAPCPKHGSTAIDRRRGLWTTVRSRRMRLQGVCARGLRGHPQKRWKSPNACK